MMPVLPVSGLPNLGDIEKKLKPLREYRELEQLYDGAIREVRTKLDVLDNEFNVRYSHNPIHHIESRLKSIESIFGKLRKKGCPLTLDSAKTNVTDIAGLRVICYYIDDIYRIAALLVKQNDIALMRVHDYIAHPKPNGYRSLHLVVKVPVFLSAGPAQVPIEIQIRTIAMDFWASLEHQLRYKSNSGISEGIPERLARCAETSAMLDLEMQDIYHSINGFGGMDDTRMPPKMQEMAQKFYENGAD